MEEETIHQRVLKLKDVAMGLKKAIPVHSSLAPASYDCTVDSLLALYGECKGASSLAKDKNVVKFINKYEGTVSALKKLLICVEDFDIKNTIGRGHFGEVMLCKEKSTDDIFAMKVMKKAHILQQPDAAYYSAERDIMAWSTSPWLTSLHYAFQDHTSLYLVMDYHPGGDLLNIMERKEGSMQEEAARFYLAEIAAGLHDLHELGFVHRDVKPENVLISRSGHIKLVDFGSAARLNSNGKVIESQLPVGTPEYISPEVLTSLDRTADYGTCCDWWSLGIIAYELLYETTPFEGDTTSKTYNNIMNYKKSLFFPEICGSSSSSEREAQDLIRKLLTNAKARLAYVGIQGHPFFSLTDWDHLLNAMPPHIPTVSGPEDVSNFDVFEPRKDDDLRYPDIPSRTTGFLGKSLPFIGFTFNGTTSSEDYTDSIPLVDASETEGVGSGELRKAVELEKKATEGERAKRVSLERECAIYQSQLEDFHRKFEMEKSDRRISDSRALQLLQEVKEKGRLAQQLREEQSRTTEIEYGVVVEQLEQERQEASKRSQRLQEKVKELQKERDLALNKVSEYKSKLSEAKEGSKKELTGLQARLAKVSKESASKVEEVRGRYAEMLKKKDQAEAAKKKAEMELRKLNTSIESSGFSPENLGKNLKTTQSTCEQLQAKLDSQSMTNEYLEKHSTSLAEQLTKMEDQLDEVHAKNKLLESEKLGLEQQVDAVRYEKYKFKKGQEKANKEVKAKIAELNKKKEEVAKLETSCHSLETKLREADTLKEVNHRTGSSEEKLKMKNLERENQKLKGNLSTISAEVKNQHRENKTLAGKMEEAEENYEKAVTGLTEEVDALQAKLKENRAASLQEGDKLRQLRKEQREISKQNADLTTKLSMAQTESEQLAKQLKKNSEEVEKTRSLRISLRAAESKIKALGKDNESARKEVTSLQDEIRKLTASRDQAEEKSSSNQKQFEDQELNTALLQRNVKSLKEELKEARAIALHAQEQLGCWKTIKETVESDLEIAEAKLEESGAIIEMEKKNRLAAEQHMSEVAEEMEKQVSVHVEELQKVTDQLLKQKELATKYSVKVLELEKEERFKGLSLREVQKDLSTEKAVSSKFYDEVQLKSRELNKLKATHMKLLQELQQLKEEIDKQQQLLSQQVAASEKHQLQETRLKSTIAQQTKLIDYLQGSGKSPESRGFGRLKGLKFGRKGRDPAREIAEWNKLKGIAGKGHSSGSGGNSSSTMSSSHQAPAVTVTTAIVPTFPPRGLTPYITSTGAGGPQKVPTTATGLASVEKSTQMECDGVQSAEVPALTTPSNVKSNPGPGVSGSKAPTRRPQTTPSNVTSSPGAGATGSVAGTKRKSVEVTSNSATSDSAPKQGSSGHNPHTFRGFVKSGLRSNYTCAACKGPIKALQKLIKCSHCHVPCHAQCIDALPQNCGVTSDHATTDTIQISNTHTFRGLIKAGLHSNYTCAACKGPVKGLQKLIKCSYCHIPCHTQCIDSLPNNCGVLPSHAELKPPSSKKQKQDPSLTVRIPSSENVSNLEKAPPKKRSKKGEVVLLRASMTSGDLCSTDTAVSDRVSKVTEKKSASKKKSKKGEVKLTKFTQISSNPESFEDMDGGLDKGGAGKTTSKTRKEPTLSQVSKVSSANGDKGKSGAVSPPAATILVQKQAVKFGDDNSAMKPIKNSFYGGFESSKVIRMEQTSQLRGGMMTEGWLVLTEETLCLYDRDPRGVTRKPIHHFFLTDPNVAYVVVPSVTRHTMPHTSPSSIVRGFGLQVHSSSGSKQLCFMTSSLQSKIDWVEAIQNVLTTHTCPPPTKHVGKESSPTRTRELKSVSIVPISTPQKQSGSGGGTRFSPDCNQGTPFVVSAEGSELDLSIRSSMLNSSPDSSFI